MANETEYLLAEKYKIITQQFTKYAGIFLFIICLYGTITNIIIFGHRIYRQRSGSRYLLVASICDFIHLNVGPLSNLLQYGYDYDWTINSVIYCQSKSYFVFVITAISATLTNLANINQYILSSKKPKQWKFNSRKTTLRCIYLTIISWFIISIPIPFCYTRHSHSSENEQLICSNPLKNTILFFCSNLLCLFN